jgi:hypothetical protein
MGDRGTCRPCSHGSRSARLLGAISRCFEEQCQASHMKNLKTWMVLHLRVKQLEFTGSFGQNIAESTKLYCLLHLHHEQRKTVSSPPNCYKITLHSSQIFNLQYSIFNPRHSLPSQPALTSRVFQSGDQDSTSITCKPIVCTEVGSCAGIVLAIGRQTKHANQRNQGG